MAEISEKTAKRRGRGRPFLPGRSGNPGGRPKEAVHVREMARQCTAQAIETLKAITLRGKTDAARVRAAEVLLARGWGQPTQPVEHTGGPVRIIVEYVADWRAQGGPAR